MTRRTPPGMWNWSWTPRRATRKRMPCRGLRIECLERRALLAATDLAAITGRVFRDATGDGYNLGEEVSSAIVRLYRDDGDNVFEPGAGDMLESTVLTNAEGLYRFDNLTEGTYFVQQPQQSVGSLNLPEDVSEPLTFDATDVMGQSGTVIDSFNQTQQEALAQTGGSTTDENSADAPEALGGERDLFVMLTSGTGSVQLRVLAFGVNPVLQFDNSAGVVGERTATWDGQDNDGDDLNPTGLGGVDLTDGGASTAFNLLIGADNPNGLVTIRVFTDGLNWSQGSVAIPNTGGLATSTVILDFSSFIVGGGSGADFSNVGAIQLMIEGSASVNGQIDTLEVIGPTVETVDFANFVPADLSLSKSVSNTTPQIGEPIVFTIIVTNGGPNPATGVGVRDQLPLGVAFVDATATQGSYDVSTGIWTVGNLGAGASATLQLRATVGTVGAKVNTAQVSSSDQSDPDSTPNNDAPGEDDQASVTVTPRWADLSLAKNVNDTTPQVGQTVIFTVMLSNSGPSAATGVQVTDVIPAGMSFVSSTPSQGSYSSGSGLWNVGTVAAGSQATLTLLATVNSAGTKVNKAEVTAADQFDPDSTPNNDAGGEDDLAQVSLTPMSVDLSLTKTVDNNAPQVNQNLTFTVTVSNAGPDTATNVVVSDPIPTGMSFVSSTPSQGSYDEATGLWAVGALANGAQATLQIVARVTQPTAQSNTAQVQSVDQADPDSTPGNSNPNEDDQATVTFSPQVADLSIIKAVDNPSPNRGETITFTVTAINSGPAAATGVAISDPLPAGLTFVSATASIGSYNPQTGIWTLGTLPNNGAATLQIVATVAASGRKTNTAQVWASDQFDPDSTPGDSIESQDDQQSVVVEPPRSLSKRMFLAR